MCDGHCHAQENSRKRTLQRTLLVWHAGPGRESPSDAPAIRMSKDVAADEVEALASPGAGELAMEAGYKPTSLGVGI